MQGSCVTWADINQHHFTDITPLESIPDLQFTNTPPGINDLKIYVKEICFYKHLCMEVALLQGSNFTSK